MRPSLLIPIAAGLLVLPACGDDTTSSSTPDTDIRTVEIEMVDIGFEPDTIEVTSGETVRFVFTNTGAVAHDAFIGDAAAQADHEAEMRDGDMDGHGRHGDTDAVTVKPGDSGEFTHTFDGDGPVQIGCHQEGHYDAGMRIQVEVA